jgi:hypothetical protein
MSPVTRITAKDLNATFIGSRLTVHGWTTYVFRARSAPESEKYCLLTRTGLRFRPLIDPKAMRVGILPRASFRLCFENGIVEERPRGSIGIILTFFLQKSYLWDKPQKSGRSTN